MKCPHCLTSFHDHHDMVELGEDATSVWRLLRRTCPECKKYIISLHQRYGRIGFGSGVRYQGQREFFCYPRAVSRVPLSPDVPAIYAEDYSEACLVLTDSPKASAALSRRCLQHLLREEAKIKPNDLAKEIQQVLDETKLPTPILESLDAVRNIGNFAAHPLKSQTTGEIMDVEEGEAEWNLDILESLFDYYFVQPAVLQRKREALNAKLKEAGKPEMK